MGVCDVSSSDSLCCPPSCTLQTQSLPALCECLRKAALDPRIKGVVVKVDPLATGWGKLQVQYGAGGWAGALPSPSCEGQPWWGVAVSLHTPAEHTPPHACRPQPQELRRHVEYFRESGKFAIAYLER